MNFSPKNLVAIAIVMFATGLLARSLIIERSPSMNNYIDLCIYMDGGRLLNAGVNPYDRADQPAARAEVMARSTNCRTYYWPHRWEAEDFFEKTSGNLPLSQLVYAGLNRVVADDPHGFRLGLALFDSLLGSLIATWVLAFWHWPLAPLQRWFLALGLGPLNPVMLKWGAYIPEDKGIQILFALSAIAFTFARRNVLGGAALGMSVAFKALGLFLVPALAQQWHRNLDTKTNHWAVIALLVWAAAICLIWFAPFFDGLVRMIQERVATSTASMPAHASPWIFAEKVLRADWILLRYAVLALLMLVALAALRKIDGVQVACCILMVAFTSIILVDGSLDRLNMVFLTVIFLWPAADSGRVKLLATTYVAGALATVGLFALLGTGRFSYELPDAAFAGIFLIALAVAALTYVFGAVKNQTANGAPSGRAVIPE